MTQNQSKNLEQRIADRIGRETPRTRGAGRAAFLALKGEIQTALTAGWSSKDIWKTLHEEGKVQVTYQAFNRYVQRFIRGTRQPARKSLETSVRPKAGFALNPSPNKEDIV